MNTSFAKKTSTVLAFDFAGYSMLLNEREKWRYSHTIVKTVKLIAQ